jgi:hypothetical protein
MEFIDVVGFVVVAVVELPAVVDDCLPCAIVVLAVVVLFDPFALGFCVRKKTAAMTIMTTIIIGIAIFFLLMLSVSVICWKPPPGSAGCGPLPLTTELPAPPFSISIK